MNLSSGLLLVLLAVVAALSALAGYSLHEPGVVEVVEYRPMERQADGSVIAERDPEARPERPPHQLPEGAVEIRYVRVEVAPDPVPDVPCPPVTVDLSLIRDIEGGHRVVASSPNGRVLTALDVPIEPIYLPPAARPWAAGVSYGPWHDRAGVWAERDLGRLRLGADLQHAETGGLRALVRVGWRF